MKLASDTKLIVAGIVVIGAAAWYLQRRLSSIVPSAAGVQTAVGDGVSYLGNYINSAAAGTVEGIGLAVGIPRTNQTACDRAKAEGRWWDASFDCPAGDFIASGSSAAYLGLFGGNGVPASAFVSGGGGQFVGNGATGSW